MNLPGITALTIGKTEQGSDTVYDYATIKYDTNGNQLWVARYDGQPAGRTYKADIPRAIAIDGAGNAFVTGYTYGIDNYRDYATIKYDTDLTGGPLSRGDVRSKTRMQL